MNRIKILLILAFVVTLVVLVSGCRVPGPGDAVVDNEITAVEELPRWLTLAHRAEAAEEPAEEEEVAVVVEAPVQPAPAQPAPAQPAPAQPAPAQPAPQPQGTPRYLQPGTMEYIAKIRLDDVAQRVRRLDNRIAAEDNRDEREKLMKERNGIVTSMYAVGAEIGLDIKKYYGIEPLAADDNLFTDWNRSPSGWEHVFD